jgi:hypothetical protein
MTEDDSESELPIGTLVVVGALILAALTLPTFAPGTAPGGENASNGTIVTPDGTTLEEVDGVDRGPLDGLNALPASHLRDDESPTVHASTGAQTMRVETTTVDGEPALNLSDDRTHDGRWVAVPTEWFNRTQGGVPSVARIAHEENGTYTEAIQVRGDSAAFYVRAFSTNTVTFGGELVIRDRPAVDGTRHSYQLDSRDSVDNLVINATGVTNTDWSNSSTERVASGGTKTVDVGGNLDPTGPSSNNEPVVEFSGVRRVVDDFESGGISEGGWYGETSYFSAQSDTVISGSFSGEMLGQSTTGAESVSIDLDSETTAPAKATIQATQTGNSNDWQRLVFKNGAGGTLGYLYFDHNGDIRWYAGGSTVIGSWGSGTPQEVRMDWDFSSDQVTIIVNGEALDTVGLSTSASGWQTLTFGVTGGGSDTEVPAYIDDVSVDTGTTDPSVDIDGDGTADASYSGTLSPDESVTRELSGLSVGSNSLDVTTSDGDVGLAVNLKERTETVDPVVEVNGETASYNGTLADGETVDLGGSVSWLEDGQNNITVHVGDGSYSGDGPEPQVDIEFRHGLESPRTVQYESEALSERYNISKTYTTARANASLTIPHARTVLSMRALDYRLNETGSWSSVPEAAANLSGTTLTVDVSTLAGDPVPEGTTIEVRSTGSRVDAHESSISVLRATPVGFDMDSRIRLDSWGTGSYLEVGETPQGGLVYYAENESYSAESDYVELFADGSQRLYAPNATSGSELTLQTLSARVSPERNSMRVRVPESANGTNTEFVVEPASVVGDSWTAEYVAGTDGQWYAVVDSAGDELGAAEKPSPIEVDRDDVGLVSIVPTEPPSASTDGAGGGIFATVTTGNLPSLLALFGSVGMLFVAGTRPAASRDAIDGVASGVDSAVSRVPRVGPAVGGALESAVSGAGSALVSVGENRLLTAAVGAAVALAAAQAGLFSVGSEAGAIISVAGIAVGSLYVLREAGEFTTARWIAIVGVAGVVALQGLGEGDLLAQFVNSDAFLIAVLIGGYAVIQLVREYRQNNSPDDDRPQVVIGGQFRSGDDEGSD